MPRTVGGSLRIFRLNDGEVSYRQTVFGTSGVSKSLSRGQVAKSHLLTLTSLNSMCLLSLSYRILPSASVVFWNIPDLPSTLPVAATWNPLMASLLKPPEKVVLLHFHISF